MIWTILSVLVCLALVIKLVFFTDHLRSHSRFFYRVVLLLAAVYAFHQVLNFLYTPGYQVNPLTAILHTILFVGAFFITPCNLPGNRSRCNDPTFERRHTERQRHDA